MTSQYNNLSIHLAILSHIHPNRNRLTVGPYVWLEISGVLLTQDRITTGLSLYTCIILWFIILPPGGVGNNHVPGWCIEGHDIAVENATSSFTCMAMCLGTDDCKSVEFARNQNKCRLNDVGRLQAGPTWVANDTFDYYDMFDTPTDGKCIAKTNIVLDVLMCVASPCLCMDRLKYIHCF